MASSRDASRSTTARVPSRCCTWRDIERIDETGVFVRLGADIAAAQITSRGDELVDSFGLPPGLLQVVADDDLAVNERKVVPASAPDAAGFTVLRMLINEHVRMPLKFRGVLGELVRDAGHPAVTESLRVETRAGLRLVAVAQLAAMGVNQRH